MGGGGGLSDVCQVGLEQALQEVLGGPQGVGGVLQEQAHVDPADEQLGAQAVEDDAEV